MRSFQSMSFRGVSFLGVAFVASAFGCSVEGSARDEQVTKTSSAVEGPSCTNGGSSNCWEMAFINAANFSTFAYGGHVECGILALAKKQVFCRSSVSGGFGTMPPNWGSTPIDLPVEGRSITISNAYAANTGVHVLGDDSVVRSTYGDVTQPPYTGTNFKQYTDSTSAIDLSNGRPICLTKITAVTLPSRYAPSWTLLGLTCSGYTSNPQKLYVRDFGGWRPWTTHPGFSSLNAAISWTDISNAASGGAYLLSSTGDIWWTAWGAAALDATVTYFAPVKLPRLPLSANGTTTMPTAVGGPFVVTDAGTANFAQCGQPGTVGCPGDDDRFFRFMESTNKWVHAGEGVPLPPKSLSDTYYVVQGVSYPYYPFYRQIFDARAVHGADDEFGTVHSYSREYLWTNHGAAAYQMSPPRPARGDYDGDGIADLVLWRPSTRTWYALYSSLGAQAPVVWGQNADQPLLGDFDGDHRADTTVLWRPPTGQWWGVASPPPVLGQSGDVPVPADYDGDGKTDLAVFRPSNGRWLLPSGTVTWGKSGDIPVPGDYNGDGTDDVAVFRPSTGQWWLPTGTLALGQSGDIPVPGDYDGDGTTEIGVFRPSNGKWLIPSGTVTWGKNGDIPAPADYDGDGRTDIAVFRPSTGQWWLPARTVAFGQSGDIPLPSTIGN